MQAAHTARPAAASVAAVPAAAGVGLRFQHHEAVLRTRPDVAWLEAHTENYCGGGSSIHTLEAIRRDYPVSLHGVGLSLGSADGLDVDHLARVREVVRRIEPGLVSEHLSWSVTGGAYLADLLPLPLTEEALAVFCAHVDQAQAFLQRRLLIENPSTYLRYAHSTIPEEAFLAEVTRRTGCGLLCDVNNIYVSACNHGWNATTYLAALPSGAIGEIHLAGHTARRIEGGPELRIDDHGSRVAAQVWALYREALALFGPRPTLIEWDNNVPELCVLLDEAARAQRLMQEAKDAVAA
jgi:uncharacterized protein (UPF0276 family)